MGQTLKQCITIWNLQPWHYSYIYSHSLSLNVIEFCNTLWLFNPSDSDFLLILVVASSCSCWGWSSSKSWFLCESCTSPYSGIAHSWSLRCVLLGLGLRACTHNPFHWTRLIALVARITRLRSIKQTRWSLSKLEFLQGNAGFYLKFPALKIEGG
jgi:hypothetical protein